MLKNAMQRLVAVVLIMGLIVPPTGSARELAGEVEVLPTSSGLYRTQVTVRSPADWARLEKLGVVVLRTVDQQENADNGSDQSASSWKSAVILADADQLETLARLRFEPRSTDELGMLVMAHAQAKPWLAASLRPLLAERTADQQENADNEGVQSASSWKSVVVLSPELKAGLAALTSIDDDADGLTNTEEQWWCTYPLNPDSDGDGVDDGDEVQALLDGDATDGPPYQGWPMVPGDSAYDPQCIDRDEDAVPDMAERWIIGLNANRETTDGDKFDDGQELFGITKSGYGDYPRSVDSDFISSNMPGWVDPPGNSPFVAAYPQISVDIVEGSIQVVLVAEITGEEQHSIGDTYSYGTAETRGTSVGIGQTETHTRQEWMEVGNSVADTYERSHYEGQMQSAFQQYSRGYSIGMSVEEERGRQASVTVGENGSVGWEAGAKVGFGTSENVGGCIGADCLHISGDIGTSRNIEFGGALSGEQGWSVEQSQGASWAQRRGAEYQDSYQFTAGSEISRETGDTVSYGRIHERSVVHGVGREYSTATTITREDYEEHTVSNEHAIETVNGWSIATSTNTSHAADLTFGYRIRNSGTDNAHRIENILFNIYIGDDRNPISNYAGVLTGDTCTQVVINDLYPGDLSPTTGPATQCKVHLNLEQLEAVDSGTPIRVVVADYSYGDDEQFYENA